MQRFKIETTGTTSQQGEENLAPQCRALTVLEAQPTHPSVHEQPHNSAAFITQLLAVREGLPQTRERRREDPDVASHVYEAHMAPPAPDQGKVLSRAM